MGAGGYTVSVAQANVNVSTRQCQYKLQSMSVKALVSVRTSYSYCQHKLQLVSVLATVSVSASYSQYQYKLQSVSVQSAVMLILVVIDNVVYIGTVKTSNRIQTFQLTLFGLVTHHLVNHHTLT